MTVSLVIPGRNAAKTIGRCLDAVVPLFQAGQLHEIIFVDDGSTDATCEIVAQYPVRCLPGKGGGPGYARNLGWRAAVGDLIWFIDSDCVAHPEALARLLPHLTDAHIAGAGGTYDNMEPDSLVACLIHQEIVERHRAMRTEVDFLGSFNVLYRRPALERIGGFDEQWVNGPGRPGAEDADLAYRLHAAGYALRFEPRSRVGHFHPVRLRRYLRAQRIHGYWRVNLHLRHARKGAGDTYSSLIDHGQPPLAVLVIALLPALAFQATRRLTHGAIDLLTLMQVPMTVRLVRRTGRWRFIWFAPLGFVRAFARGLGMVEGVLAIAGRAIRGQPAFPPRSNAPPTPPPDRRPSPDTAGRLTEPPLAASVSLVIPGRNAAKTVGPCLEAVVPLLHAGRLHEIIFVDDSSTDRTREIVAQHPVHCLPGRGRGPGAARNLGWQTATGNLVWFIDSDCIAEPDALDRLLPHLADPLIGGAGGSYGNMCPDSRLACLIHEEIVERHLSMPTRVNFLATFNVIYRRAVLEQIGGFDERFLKGQDAELAWRVLEAGYQLAFERESRVKHFHPTSWWKYFATQRQQGYWRVWLHLTHRGHATGDSYSSLLDHIRPPLAMLILASIPVAVAYDPLRWLPAAFLAALLASVMPLTWRLVRRTGQWSYLLFAVMGVLRAFWRGIGMSAGTLAVLRKGLGRSPNRPSSA